MLESPVWRRTVVFPAASAARMIPITCSSVSFALSWISHPSRAYRKSSGLTSEPA